MLDLATRITLSEIEAAEYLGMSSAWLKKSRTRRWCSSMDAPCFVKAGGRRVVYRRRDLDDWLDAHRMQAPAR